MLAVEFSNQIEAALGQSAESETLKDSMKKYGFSLDDVDQLRSNLGFVRKDDYRQMKVSVSLPISEGGPRTIELIRASLTPEQKPTEIVVFEPPNPATH